MVNVPFEPNTGPPYPPPPNQIPQNYIGQYDIGVSQIGTVIPFSYWDTIISQYANSPRLTALIGNFDQYIDQTKNFDQFYDSIWNVATAQGLGLDIWGRIVGVQRVVAIQTAKFFGFEEQTPQTVEDFGPGGVGPFYNGIPATSNYALADQSFRQLIYAKAMANISNGSTASINQILLRLFPFRGNCYATDGRNMTMTYTFEFPLTTVEQAVVQQSGVLPKPTGVKSSIVIKAHPPAS